MNSPELPRNQRKESKWVLRNTAIAGFMGLAALLGCTTSPGGGTGNTLPITMLEEEQADKTFIAGCDSNTTGYYSQRDNPKTPNYDLINYSYADGLVDRGANKVIKAAINGTGIHSVTPTLAEQAVANELAAGVPSSKVKVIQNCVVNSLAQGVDPEQVVDLNIASAERLENQGVEVLFLATPPIQPGSITDKLNPGGNEQINYVNTALEEYAANNPADYIKNPLTNIGYDGLGVHLSVASQSATANNVVAHLNGLQ